MRRGAPLLAILFLLACGPKSMGSDGEASDSEASGGSTGGATGEVTTGVDACEQLADVAPSPAVTITLRNAGSEPVFFVHATGCDFVEPLTIVGPDSDTPVIWRRDGCTFTCSEVADGFCECPAFCAQDSVLALSPGGVYTITWSGARYVPTTAPAECLDPQQCGTNCWQQLQAAPGVYELTAAGGSEITGCLDPNNCTCTPNADGWCDVTATGVGGAPRSASASLTYPGTVAEIVF